MTKCTPPRSQLPPPKMQQAPTPRALPAGKIDAVKKPAKSVGQAANASKVPTDEFAPKNPQSGPVPLGDQTGLTKVVGLREAPPPPAHPRGTVPGQTVVETMAKKASAEKCALKNPQSGPVPLGDQTGLTKAVDAAESTRTAPGTTPRAKSSRGTLSDNKTGVSSQGCAKTGSGGLTPGQKA
jgi:hypothetical protein